MLRPPRATLPSAAAVVTVKTTTTTTTTKRKRRTPPPSSWRMIARFVVRKPLLLLVTVSLSLVVVSRSFLRILHQLLPPEVRGTLSEEGGSELYRKNGDGGSGNDSIFYFFNQETGKLQKWNKAWGPPPQQQQQQQAPLPPEPQGMQEHYQNNERDHSMGSSFQVRQGQQEEQEDDFSIHENDATSHDRSHGSTTTTDDNNNNNNMVNQAPPQPMVVHPNVIHRHGRRVKRSRLSQGNHTAQRQGQSSHQPPPDPWDFPSNPFFEDSDEDATPLDTNHTNHHRLSSKRNRSWATRQRQLPTLKLPKPILVMGFPKAGTSSVFTYFKQQGFRTQHWYCCRSQSHPQDGGPGLMAGCMLHNMERAATVRAKAMADAAYASYSASDHNDSHNSNATTTTTNDDEDQDSQSPYLRIPSIMDGCGNFDVYTELNGPRRQKKFGRLGFPKTLGVLLDDGTYDRKGPASRIFFPQHFYIHQLHDHAPNATWILNIRDVDEWVHSVLNWGDDLASQFANEYYMQQSPLFAVRGDGNGGDGGAAVGGNQKETLRSSPSSSSSSRLVTTSVQPNYHDAMLAADAQTTTVGSDIRRPGDDVSYENHHSHPRFDYPITTDTVMAHFLKTIYQHHHDMVREFVKAHPSHILIEINITDDETGQVLADAFGLNSTEWGQVNKNDKRFGSRRSRGGSSSNSSVEGGPSSHDPSSPWRREGGSGGDGGGGNNAYRQRPWRAYQQQQQSWYSVYILDLDWDEIGMWGFVVLSAAVIGHKLGTHCIYRHIRPTKIATAKRQ
jgi:hypothetical protein